ncbi:MAG: hypothetical protein GXY32_05885 [Ruminococcaceae bacterium]|nr:hypothetical protein [Oscillospiraceae bacterium]
MKKVMVMLVAAMVLCASLAACSGNNNSSSSAVPSTGGDSAPLSQPADADLGDGVDADGSGIDLTAWYGTYSNEWGEVVFTESILDNHVDYEITINETEDQEFSYISGSFTAESPTHVFDDYLEASLNGTTVSVSVNPGNDSTGADAFVGQYEKA